ncbi:DivIVA domain-containing protein [Microbacterium sp. NC79]|uniref:DivIVA domain-containing protein n=1 Tax=Microbacterium sp. NC79 TaxID=2851009 RepID=UPI001C2BA669|nr:DivIVA domain-containing protein [Microbacterium sp. NC79]MBV0894700.1 DivIVA domain-containing protein [Microbacterium sp. NC79]
MAGSVFPVTAGREKGYEQRAVDAFLAQARAAFERREGAPEVTSQAIREVAFPLAKEGYSIAHVDGALGRIEDAFAAREREAAMRREGARVWVDQAREAAQDILVHLARPKKQRFARTSVLTYGYRVDEVDIVMDKLTAFLERGHLVTVEQVRAAAFRMQRRGYREEQVDALLDAVVDVMLAVTPTR